MDVGELRFHLEQLAFSADFPAEVLQQLAKAAQLQDLTPSQVVFREGGVNHMLYLVVDGRLALEMLIPGRGASRILTIGPGEMCGWSALLGEGKMTATALATQNTKVVAIAGDQLRQLCDDNRDFGFHLMRQMAFALSSRLIATRLQLLDLFGDGARVTTESTDP